MTAAGVLALLMALAAQADPPRQARVVVESMDVLAEPDDAAATTGLLKRGDRVVILRDGPEGWVAIRPPRAHFSLIEEADVEEIDATHARVTARFASVRPGIPGARRCPARLARPSAATRSSASSIAAPWWSASARDSRTWLAIAPPKEEARFVRSDGLDETVLSDEDDDAPRRDSLVSAIARPVNRPMPELEPPRIAPIWSTVVSSPSARWG